MEKRYFYKIIPIIIVVFLITGCQGRQDVSEENLKGSSIENEISQEEYENELGLDVSGRDYDLLMRSEGISDSVVNLFGIDNATSIVFNDIVAIAVKLAEENELNNSMRELIMDVTLENDSMVRQVLITENEDVFEEIENVIISLMNGQTYDSQVKEINRIIENIKNN